jgi:phosphoglycolate phosphatase
MKFEAVIFDADGTLLDTLEDLADSMNGVLRAFGYPEHPIAEYRYFVGDGMENLVRRTLPGKDRLDPAAVSRCFELMREKYASNWNRKTRPYSGVPELLDGLSRLGVRMSVLSNKPHDFTVSVIETMLAKWKFDVVLGERPGVPRKPDPAGAVEIADRLGIDPARFLYLGDTATDMLTANAAGMFGVGALWGFRTAEELLSAGAWALIAAPAELLNFL